jgi:hypothetical protein
MESLDTEKWMNLVSDDSPEWKCTRQSITNTVSLTMTWCYFCRKDIEESTHDSFVKILCKNLRCRPKYFHIECLSEWKAARQIHADAEVFACPRTICRSKTRCQLVLPLNNHSESVDSKSTSDVSEIENPDLVEIMHVLKSNGVTRAIMTNILEQAIRGYINEAYLTEANHVIDLQKQEILRLTEIIQAFDLSHTKSVIL